MFRTSAFEESSGSSNEFTSEPTVDNDEIEHQFTKPTETMKPPHFGERIEYVDKKGDTSVAKFTCRYGKPTGIYKFCFKVEKSDG